MNSFFSLSNIFSELKRSLRLALPLIASEVIYALNAFIATIMVAHLGKDQLAANALVWGIYITVILFFIGILTAVGIMVSQSDGAKDDRGIAICFKQGLILAIIFAFPMMLIMWYSPVVLAWTGQKAEVIAFAKPFFHALIWSILPLNIFIVIQQFLIGISKTRSVMLMSLLQVPVEIFFYYGFLFGKFGLPKVGLAGIGYGLLVSFTLISIVFGCYLLVSQRFKKHALFEKWWQVNRKFLLELFHVGYPLGFLYCIEVALFAVIAIMMGVLGTDTLAAYQITYQYFVVALTVVFALTQSVTVRVGNEVGQNNRPGLQLAAIINLIISIGLMLLFSIFYIGFPKIAISLDINIHAANLQIVVEKASTYLSIIGILILTDCVRLISLGSLRGLKDTKFPVLVSIIGFWCIGFTSAYLFGFKFHWGGTGILCGVLLGLVVAGIMLIIRFYRLSRRIDLVSLVTK